SPPRTNLSAPAGIVCFPTVPLVDSRSVVPRRGSAPVLCLLFCARSVAMLRLLTKAILPLAVVIACGAGATAVQAEDYCRPWQPHLFYNFYVSGAPCPATGLVPAQLYVSPRPPPPMVGHTYITSHPLLPHEFLYRHDRCYFTWHGMDGGLTCTKVC